MQDEYTSCLWLEGGLWFCKNELYNCCYPNIIGKTEGMPYICSYEGGPLPVEEILKSRQVLVSKLNNGEECTCSNCIFLQKKRWPKTEYILDYVINFSPYTLCNLNCSYCSFAREGDCRMYFPLLPVIKHLVEEKYMSPETTAFGWTGGEPTIVKEFNEGYSLISQSVKKVLFHTNSVVFSDAIYRNLGDKSIAETFVKTSIDAGTPETYNKIRGRDFFYRVFDNLQKYAEKSPQTVFAKYIVLSENCDLHEVRSFIDQVSRRNIKRVELSADFASWNIPTEHWTALEALLTGLEKNDVDVIFSHHLMALIYTTDIEKVPKQLYSKFVDLDSNYSSNSSEWAVHAGKRHEGGEIAKGR